MVPRVAGPRPLRSQRVPHAKREPALAAPKAVYLLLMRLTNFEVYEDESPTEFFPPPRTFPPGFRASCDNYRGTPLRSNVHF